MPRYQGFNGSSIKVRGGRKRIPGIILKDTAAPPTVRSLNKKVRRMKNSMETKSVTSQVGPSAMGTAGTLLLLNGIQRGSAPNNRTGNGVRATSVWFMCEMFNDDDNTDTNVVRLILFWDRQANSAVPSISGDIDSQGLLDTGTGTSVVFSPPNMNQKERYKIIYDKSHSLQPRAGNFNPATGALTSVIAASKIFRKKINLARLIQYGGSGATIADLDTNSLYALFITDTNTNPPMVYFSARFNYKDN